MGWGRDRGIGLAGGREEGDGCGTDMPSLSRTAFDVEEDKGLRILDDGHKTELLRRESDGRVGLAERRAKGRGRCI